MKTAMWIGMVRRRCAQVRSRIHPARKLDVMKLHAVHGGGELLVAERRGRAGNVNFRAIGDQRAAQLAQKAEVTDESGNDNQQAHWNGFHAAGATIVDCCGTLIAAASARR